ncbi:MAG: ABC transporter permease [Cellulomonadaceae bacterium]|jgi:putative ABC transport system permease protein|nr:ABC transporter permease [Cellulomonadaceae bacterium]
MNEASLNPRRDDLLRPRRLSFRDLLGTAWIGVGGRPQRTALAALGVALGIAALVALTSASASSQQQILNDLDALGANLVIVGPGNDATGDAVFLPQFAPEAIARQPGVRSVGVLDYFPLVSGVYRSDLVPITETSGIHVTTARPDAFEAIGATLARGRWFDDVTRALPVTVLSAIAAARLGAQVGDNVYIDGQWYGVLGILSDSGVASGRLDGAAILGDAWVRDNFAGQHSGIGEIQEIYVRAEPGMVDTVREGLARVANPATPHFVALSGASNLADARALTDDTLATLGLALGGISLLVGGVGIANTMVVTVLERRGEIGLRRALGARPGQIAAQFVGEAIGISLIGGLAGLILGVIAAIVIALITGQPIVIPFAAIVVGPLLSVIVGAIAGLQPAIKATRLSPTTALRAI